MGRGLLPEMAQPRAGVVHPAGVALRDKDFGPSEGRCGPFLEIGEPGFSRGKPSLYRGGVFAPLGRVAIALGRAGAAAWGRAVFAR